MHEKPVSLGESGRMSIQGMLFAWDTEANEPPMLRVNGSPLAYLPLFPDEDALDAAMEHLGMAYDGVKQIDDSDAFLMSLEGFNVVVVCDLEFLGEGNVRFKQIRFDGAN